MFTVISFYTNDWEYPNHARNLKDDCVRLGLESCIEELESTGSYLKNTCLKPRFIRDKLLKLKSPVLWVDCDGTILKRPDFFSGLQFDMAAKRMSPGRKRTWHVGTLWVNYTPAMLGFLERWIDNTGAISDESALEKTWRQHTIKVIDIPPQYFRIMKRGEQLKGDEVIIHRISDGPAKRRELPRAIKKAKAGIL